MRVDRRPPVRFKDSPNGFAHTSSVAVSRHPNGSWRAQVDLPREGSLPRRRKSLGYFDTKKDAERAIRRELDARDRGERDPESVTVDDLLARYIAARVAQGKVGVRQQEEYAGIARRWISPWIGHMFAAQLRPANLDRLVSDLRAKGGDGGRPLAAKSVKHAFALLKAALGWAERQEIVQRNVATLADAPAVRRKEAKAYSVEELVQILAAARAHRFEHLYVVAILTGCRRGELAALRWPEVDLRAATLVVRRNVVKTKAGLTIKEAKSDRVRGVALSKLAVDALKAQKKRLGAQYDPQGLVFPSLAGEQLDPDAITQAFYDAAVKLRLETTAFHALRHSASSLMIASGVDPVTAAAVLGHSSPVITLGTYAHVVAGAQAAAVAAIEERLARGTKKGTTGAEKRKKP